ncbi:MAG: serine/threonine protein kinase [Proteobacteria bacterium]|nr:serine/threonine protein kinase [Pseudomonadota bacterium]
MSSADFPQRDPAPRPRSLSLAATDSTTSDAGGDRLPLGDVRLGPLIGAGISSEVFAGENVTANKPCAVKVFRGELAVSAVTRGRFQHALARAARLEHPALAEVFRCGHTPEGLLYTTAMLCPGYSLRQLLRQHLALARRIALPLMRQLGNALGAAHAQDLPHLRLHPGNVMVRLVGDEVGDVKLLDFGVCQLHPPLNEPPAALRLSAEDGLWVAPEQAKGEVGDQRSDVYALSVLLYTLVTGQAPFAAETYAMMLERQLGEAPAAPSRWAQLAPELEATILRGLEKDPRRRVPSVEALLSAIDPLTTSTGRHQMRAKRQQAARRTLSTGEYRVAEASGEFSAGGTLSGVRHVALSPTASSEQPAPGRPRGRRWRWVAAAGGALGLIVLSALRWCR